VLPEQLLRRWGALGPDHEEQETRGPGDQLVISMDNSLVNRFHGTERTNGPILKTRCPCVSFIGARSVTRVARSRQAQP
jgi:hypothetical protein